MRTTVTLDPDTEQIVRRRMRERNVSFKEALNDAIRSGATPRPAGADGFRTQTARLGQSRVNLDRALQVAGDLEDDELIRRMRGGS
ncbi:MAG: antitoxin [Acidimicrobiales bacterium]